LHYLAIAALLALAALVGYAGWRRDRRAAATFALVLLITNGVVQGLKHGQLPAPSGLNPLSGHAGLAAGLSYAWLLTSVGGVVRWRRPLLWLVAVLVAGTGGAVLLTGWHTLPQVLAPIGIGSGCALVGRALAPADLPSPTSRRGGFILIGVGVVLGFAALLGMNVIAAADPLGVALPIAALLTMVAAATSAGVGLVGVSVGRLRRRAGPVTTAN
jgi:hypothetical protein